MQRTLVIMVKDPRAGRVKTRLAKGVGAVEAAWWFRHASAALIARLRDPRWRLVLAVTPDQAKGSWPANIPRQPQGHGDLGARMTRQLRSPPPGPVCVIGADIPGVTRSHIARAFAALGSHDAVFGPACDGGYWLVGHARRRALPPRLFKNVRWSTRHALKDSIGTLPDHSIALGDRLSDVDTVEDLHNLAEARRHPRF